MTVAHPLAFRATRRRRRRASVSNAFARPVRGLASRPNAQRARPRRPNAITVRGQGASELAGVRIAAAGWGTWIRTKTNRVRVCCATVTPFPNGLPSEINSLFGCPGKSHAAGPGQITARWSERSTRLILSLASAEAKAFLRSALPGRCAFRLAEAATSIAARWLQAWCDRRCPRIRHRVCAASARETRSVHILRPMTDIASTHRRAAQLAGLSRACNACPTKQDGNERRRHSARQLCERARSRRAHLLETIA